MEMFSRLCRTHGSGLPKDGEHHVRSSLPATLPRPGFSRPACRDGGWEGRRRLFLKDAVFWMSIQQHFKAKAASLSPERESDPLLLLNTPRHIFWSSLQSCMGGRAPPVPQKRSGRPEARVRAPQKGGPESSGHCCGHRQRGANPEPPYNSPPGSGQNPLKPAALRHKLCSPPNLIVTSIKGLTGPCRRTTASSQAWRVPGSPWRAHRLEGPVRGRDSPSSARRAEPPWKMNGSRYDLLQETPGTPRAPPGTRSQEKK